MEPVTLALLALGGATLMSGTRVKVGKPDRDFFGEDPDRDAVASYIADSARYVSSRYNTMTPLWKFMLATAWRESRFNPYSKAGNKQNSARGLFQLRPNSVFTESNGLISMRGQPDILLDPVWNFVMAVDYAARGIIKANNAGQNPDVLAIRRYWSYPRNVTDVYNKDADSRITLSRLGPSLDAVGLSRSTMQEKMALGGYPGLYQIGKDFNLWK